MKDYSVKTYVYRCKCGYELKVFIDSGIPQQQFKCRKCSNDISRQDA